jgi:hypothetical protein
MRVMTVVPVPGTGVPLAERDHWQIVLAARHEQVHRWVPLDIIDVHRSPVRIRYS